MKSSDFGRELRAKDFLALLIPATIIIDVALFPLYTILKVWDKWPKAASIFLITTSLAVGIEEK